MQASIIDQGLNLMLYGMGTVFVFLTVLVFSTKLMSVLVRKMAPAETTELPPIDNASDVQAQIPPQIVQAIKLAIEQHRAR